jgi:hypothetical protein
MSDRSDFPDEDLDLQDEPGVTGLDALGVLAVAAFLAAVGLITFLLTSAVAIG